MASVLDYANVGKVQPPVSTGAGNMLGLLVPGAISLFASLFGSHQQKNATNEATDKSIAAQLKAAELEKQAADEALAETRRQSQQALYSTEAARKGNYGIYAASQRRLGTLSELAGFGAREIPAYVPDPGVGGGSGGAMYPSRPENMPKPGEVDWSSPQLQSQLSAYFRARGVPDAEVPYWVSKAGELTARGKEINNPNYANERLAASDVFGRAPVARPVGTLASYAQVEPRKRVLTAPLSAGGY